ncbi:unnamed protein product, partial [Mesorhabditis belari]|uniref:Heme oxygenase n=1 Tax=Mesorhabditis belari TaxID=2138241 RepID=A0AAF3EPX8_9BILA
MVAISVPTENRAIHRLEKEIEPLRKKLAAHPLYKAVQNVDQLKVLMENHVFAVWDFMGLLKELQRGLTCIDVPWRPVGMRDSRRLINEIVLGEESDQIDGRNISHLELYLESMYDAGANTRPINRLLEHFAKQKVVDISDDGLKKAFAECSVPKPARDFVRSTFEAIRSGKLHVVASAFTFGREDLIPLMFTGLLKDMNQKIGDGSLNSFIVYLERHIEVDGDEHGPMALQMVAEICGNERDPRWNEAIVAAKKALTARIALWDGVVAEIEKRNSKKA